MVLDQSVFSVEELSLAITNLPTRIGNVGDIELFRTVSGTTNQFSVEFYADTNILVPTTPWGGVAPKNSTGKRTAKSWQIPHMPLEDVVLASDVMGVRGFGTSEAETVQGKVLDKLQGMKNKIDATLAFRRMKAKQGIILDADGSTLINYFTDFDISQSTVDFLLGTAGTNVLAKCQEVKNKVEDALGQEVFSLIEVEVDQAFYDALTSHANVTKYFLNWSGTQQLLGNGTNTGFVFGDLKFVVNRQSIGGTPIHAAKTGVAYPRGTQNVFVTALAPADFNETVNTLALPYYAKQDVKKFERGFDLHVQSNQLPMTLNPLASVKVSSSN